VRASRSGEEEGVEAIRFSTVVVIVAVLFIEYKRQPSTKCLASSQNLRRVAQQLAKFVDTLSFVAETGKGSFFIQSQAEAMSSKSQES